MLKIGLTDDHQLFRKSLALLINSFDGMDVVLEAENGREFLDKLEKQPIDIVLLDIQMPEMNGFETCKVLHEKYPAVKILIVSQLTAKESVHKMMELGAHGYFTKNSDPDLLENALLSLEENGYYFDADFNEVMLEAIKWEQQNPDHRTFLPPDLSKRELQIIRMAANEMSSAEIGLTLCINKRTVDTHKMKIMEKTGSRNFLGVVLYAIRHKHLFIEEL